MQAILIVLPIFAYAFLVGIALVYVLSAVFPRRRRSASGETRAACRKPAPCPSRSPETPVVDADQQAGRRNV